MLVIFYTLRNDNPDIVSGQGTMGLEIVDQLEEVDAIIIPVGGGTLIAGTCIAVKTLYPSVKIIVSVNIIFLKMILVVYGLRFSLRKFILPYYLKLLCDIEIPRLTLF